MIVVSIVAVCSELWRTSGVVIVSVVLSLMPEFGSLANIVAVPSATPVARPVASMLATLELELVQVTFAVLSREERLEKDPVAVYWSVCPASID